MCFNGLLTADMVYSCMCERQWKKEEGRISLVYLNKRVNSLENCVNGCCDSSGVQSSGSDLFKGVMTREQWRIV